MEKLAIMANAAIRRKLFLAALLCLGGVYAAGIMPRFYALAAALCAMVVLTGILRARHSSGKMFYAFAAVLLLGYALAGHALCMQDEPTRSGANLSGRVKRIISDTRIILEDVSVDGENLLRRPAAVTLMLEEEEVRGPVHIGQRVTGTGRLFKQNEPRNPGETDWRISALCDGYDLSGYILPGWKAEGEAVFSLEEAFRRARLAIFAWMEQVFGEDAALYQAVLLGDRSGMEADVVRSMRLTGTAHILTVSGLHLGILCAALDLLLHWLTHRRLLQAAIKAILLICFTCLTGGAPGTVRALIMALLRELASLRGKRYDPMTALAVAALIMTCINPVWPLDGSFRFSFYVVLGVLLLGEDIFAMLMRRVPEQLRGAVRPIISVVSVSVSAQLAALPVQLLFYGYLPLLALPMNLATGTIAPLLMTVGALCTAIGSMNMRMGSAMASVLATPGRLFEHACITMANMPGGILRLPAPYGIWIVLAAAFMALCSRRIVWHTGTKRLRPVLAALLILLYLPRFIPTARYVQLDVGQGDGAVLRNGRHAVLVDVGPSNSYAALSYLRHEGLQVDRVVLSHLDEDHAGALGRLLASEVSVGEIDMAVGAIDDAGSETVLTALKLAEEMGVHVAEFEKGDAFDAVGAHFLVLSPDDIPKGDNERSLLLLTHVQGVRLLFTGDLPASVEPENPPDCDILKVAHHGSKNATSVEFLQAVTPQIAIISVGAGNRYGHPTQRVLNDLADVGAKVYRTDECGCLTLWLYDHQWHMQTFFPSKAS